MTKRTRATNDNWSLADEVLIRQAVAGDARARERLAAASLPRVRRLVGFAYGRKEDTEDVIQIAMVTVFKDLYKLRNFAGFRTWMDKVVFNVVRYHGRRRTRLLAVFSKNELRDSDSIDARDPEKRHASAQLFHRIQRHLDNVSAKKRTAAVMSLFFGYVDSEIAELVGCSVETAKKRVQHGRKELFSRFEKDPECRRLLEEVGR